MDLPRRQGRGRVHRARARATREWREKGLTARELAFAKRYLVRSHAFDIDTAQKRVHQNLDVDLFDLPADYHSHYIEHIQAVTLESANEAIRNRTSQTISSFRCWARMPTLVKGWPQRYQASKTWKSSRTTLE